MSSPTTRAPRCARLCCSWSPRVREPWCFVVLGLTCRAGHDLLAKMLEMNPLPRISAADALAHPYFDDVKLPAGMPKYVDVAPKGSTSRIAKKK